MKFKFNEFALLLGTIILFFIIAEITTRGFLYFDKENLGYVAEYHSDNIGNLNKDELSLIDLIKLSSNNKIVYELKPNVSGTYINSYVEINSKGVRDYEYQLTKSKNTFRIVGIGDSIMFGQGINLEDTFLKVLEKKLNENSLEYKYEVINFAVPGYNAAMEAETLKQKSLKYNPDLIILNSVSNDLHLPNFVRNKSEIGRLDKSYFYDLMVYKIHFVSKPRLVTAKLIGAPYRVDKDGAFYEYESELAKIPPEYSEIVGWNGVNKSFKEIYGSASKKRIKVVVLLDYNDDEIMEEYVKTKDYSTYSKKAEYNNEIKKLSEIYGFYLIDPVFGISDYMNEHNITAFSNLTIPEDGHPNEMYHQAVGNQLFYFLIENNLV